MEKRTIKKSVVALFLFAIFLMSNTANAQDISDFAQLKQTLTDSGGNLDASLTGSTYQFDSTLDITGVVTLEGAGADVTLEADGALKNCAFKIETEGNLTVQNMTIKNFGSSAQITYGAIENKGNLTIGPNTIFERNLKSSGYVYGASIGNLGSITIKTSADGDVVFNRISDVSRQYDIEMNEASSLTITGDEGKVVFNNGILTRGAHITNAKITHSGKNTIVLSGSNAYYGTFENLDGTVEVSPEATYFQGSSTYTGGTLNWYTQKTFTMNNLRISGANLTVGNGHNGALLDIGGASDISQAKNIVINSNARLSLLKNTTFNAGNETKISGGGTLEVIRATLTINGDVLGVDSNELKFRSTNSKVIIQNTSGNLLDIIASGNNSGLELTIQNFSGGLTSSDLNVDGNKVVKLTFLSGTNKILAGTISIQNSEMLNQGDTTLSGNLIISENSTVTNNNSLTLHGLTNENRGTITNTGSIYGSLKNISNGEINSSGNLQLESLENSGTVTSTAGAFNVSGTLQNNSKGTVKGKKLTVGKLENDNATVTVDGLTVDKEGMSNTNSGTITVNGQSNITGKFTNGSNSEFTTQGGTFEDIENDGKINFDRLKSKIEINGKVSGSGTIINNGSDITLSANEHDFSGDYIQETGSITFNDSLFNGKKQIKKGTITATAEDTNYGGVIELWANTTLNYTATGKDKSNISNSNLSFAQTGANANYTGQTGFNLNENIKGKGNFLNFKDTTVVLEGTDFSDSCKITLDNSTLDLEDGSINNYKFSELESKNNSKLDFDVKIVDDHIVTDTVQGTLKGSFTIGNLYIDSSASKGHDSYKTQTDVLSGNMTFSSSSFGGDHITYGSNDFEYDVYVSSNRKSIELRNGRAAGAETLNSMNIIDGDTRQFATSGEYKIEHNLDATGGGNFSVFGKTLNKNNDKLNGNQFSFFNIGESKSTNLSLKDLTIYNSKSDKGGSVLRNESSLSRSEFNNTIIQDNESTDSAGGAIYNNGGNDDGTTGVFVSDTVFENNKSQGQGGAIYNDSQGYLELYNVRTAKGSADAKNDIYNAGKTVTKGSNRFESQFTTKGELKISGNDTFADLQIEGGTVDIDGNNVTIESVSSESGTITHKSGTLNIVDASKFTSEYSQTNGTTTVDSNSKFFGGNSTITGGTLNWNTNQDLKETASLTVQGNNTYINIGNSRQSATLSLREGSSIDANIRLYYNSQINLTGGDLSIDSADIWEGTINLSEGKLSLDGINNYQGAVLNATGGELDIKNGGIIISNNSKIESSVKTNIGANSNITLSGGTVDIGTDDSWDGYIYMNSGTLNYEGTKNSTLVSTSGTINLKSGDLKLDEKCYISGTSVVNIEKEAAVDITGGTLQIDSSDKWEGEISLNGGTLNYHTKNSGILSANSGHLNLMKDSVLTIEDPSVVKDTVSVDVQSGSTVDIKSGKFTLDTKTGDKWNGLVKNEGGEFRTKGIDNTVNHGGHLQQESGSVIFESDSNIVISGKDSYIKGGDISVLGNSNLTFETGNNIVLNSLTVSNDSSFSIMNSIAQTLTADTQYIEGNSNFSLDINASGHGDKFVIKNLKSINGKGNINVTNFRFVGGAPKQKNIKIQLFDVKNVDENITFSATNKKIKTQFGEYKLTSLGDGMYMASFCGIDTSQLRGQVATVAMYNNQLAIEDTILNHMVLHSDNTTTEKTANKYAAANPLFAPYQYTKEEGGLWFKSYVDIGKIALTQNMNVNSSAYGYIMGADLPLMHLKHGWDFIPTVYIAYNGSNQSYNKVSMYQNGGQGGFMGTFIKKDFIGSIMAYGGGYLNEMCLEGSSEDAGNWFAGTAAKLAYNFHPTKHFILQPTAMIAYNAFGKQNWGTDFGATGMNSGMMNGINVAPGVNFIYKRDTWSFYATFQYMFNINDEVGGKMDGTIDLPEVRMRHGYIQYGFGLTKQFKDRIDSYFQFILRNGGRTSVGFQLGLQYMFDWRKPFSNLKKTKTAKISKK